MHAGGPAGAPHRRRTAGCGPRRRRRGPQHHGQVFAGYGELPNYRRLLDIGGAPGPAEAAIVGDEIAVTARIEALFAAGATDVWAGPFPVGDDRSAWRARTRALLTELANS